MAPDHDSSLPACAEVIVRIGLNLQPGQRLLIAEPYELQGVCPEASGLVQAVTARVLEIGCPPPEIIWGDAPRLRQYAEHADWRGFARLVASHADRMKAHLSDGGAFLFPISSFPHLMKGIASEQVGELRRIAWEHFGPIVQRLTRGESQWTLVPAAAPDWAAAVYPELPAEKRLQALKETVGAALRVGSPGHVRSGIPDPADSPIQRWQAHLASLDQLRDKLNRSRHKWVRYQGDGTDLTVKLPVQHRWCTAQLTTQGGITFVANLPTEEVFTAPDSSSAEGTVRVSRPVNFGGDTIDGIELVFKKGCVVQAQARTGGGLLQRLLETDDGSSRLGEVAIIRNRDESFPSQPVPREIQVAPTAWPTSGRLYYHTLLDENVSNHIALGESYPFCNRSLFGFGLNRSLVHVDLPLDARATFG